MDSHTIFGPNLRTDIHTGDQKGCSEVYPPIRVVYNCSPSCGGVDVNPYDIRTCGKRGPPDLT